jgi:FixJ family two-component response regulator
MSARELDVAARVEAGMSARQITAELGIEETILSPTAAALVRMSVANLCAFLLG